MCFSSKPKTPKVNTALPAPEPVAMEEPKGVEFGSEESGAENSGGEDSTKSPTRIEREGDSSETPPATSKATSPKRKKYTLSASSVKRSLSKK